MLWPEEGELEGAERELTRTALAPELIQLDRFLAAWNDPDTQSALQALVAKLGK